jgi:hypothetical protein
VGSGSASCVSLEVSVRQGSPGELRLKLSGPLDRGDELIGGGGSSLNGDACFFLDPIRGGTLHACKPFQGLFHFSLAAPSGHAGDGEYQLLGLSHCILLV